MRGFVTSTGIAAEGVAQAMQLAGDELRLATATLDQLNAAAAFLAKALARFPDSTSRDPHKFEAVGRLEVANIRVEHLVEIGSEALGYPKTDPGAATGDCARVSCSCLVPSGRVAPLRGDHSGVSPSDDRTDRKRLMPSAPDNPAS
jgi:hypothetical protein